MILGVSILMLFIIWLVGSFIADTRYGFIPFLVSFLDDLVIWKLYDLGQYVLMFIIVMLALTIISWIKCEVPPVDKLYDECCEAYKEKEHSDNCDWFCSPRVFRWYFSYSFDKYTLACISPIQVSIVEFGLILSVPMIYLYTVFGISFMLFIVAISKCFKDVTDISDHVFISLLVSIFAILLIAVYI